MAGAAATECVICYAPNPFHVECTGECKKMHPLLDEIPLGPDGLHAYFVHSYQFKTANKDDLVAQTEYGGPLTAIVGRDNIVGTQFHPEKSQRFGLALIANFLKWKP